MATPTSNAVSDSTFPAFRPGPAKVNPRLEPDDLYLVAMSKSGSTEATDKLIRRYHGFVRLKASPTSWSAATPTT